MLLLINRIVNSLNRSRPSRSQRVPPGKTFPEEVYRVVPRPSVICEGRNLFSQYFPPIAGILTCTQVIIVGVTFQSNCRFNRHLKNKMIKANKCVHILRTLRKEGYNQSETNHLFKTLVLPNFLYVLAVYSASESDLSMTSFRSRKPSDLYRVNFPPFCTFPAKSSVVREKPIVTNY